MSQRFKIAHVTEQGVDLIIVPLEPAFNHKSLQQQRQFIGALQGYADEAGLAGTVVPVWQNGGRMQFIAPQGFHPFFRSISWNVVISNLNKELICG